MTAPASVITNYFGNQILALTLSKVGGWLALHVGNPGVTGDISTELAGGSYDRQRILFAPPSGKVIISTDKQKFTGVPTSLITWIAVWDSYVAGHCLIAQPLPTPMAATTSGQVLAAVGDVAFAL